MKFPADKLDTLRGWVHELDTPEVRDHYRDNVTAVKDLNQRYRWDLWWAALGRNDADYSWRDTLPDLNDSHIDTALRAVVSPLQ